MSDPLPNRTGRRGGSGRLCRAPRRERQAQEEAKAEAEADGAEASGALLAIASLREKAGWVRRRASRRSALASFREAESGRLR